jgi:hypothetical protein
LGGRSRGQHGEGDGQSPHLDETDPLPAVHAGILSCAVAKNWHQGTSLARSARTGTTSSAALTAISQAVWTKI